MAVYTAIDDPELYFQVKTYSGTGSSQAITLDGDEDMQPDFVCLKRRRSSRNSALLDAVRGGTEQLISNSTAAEATDAQLITAFDSDGFSLGTSNDCNSDTDTFVAWCFKESGTAGFDIVSYTGDGANRAISHSLSAKPAMILVKQRSTDRDWWVYNKNLDGTDGATGVLYLSTTDAAGTGATTSWNSTAPTTSVFSLGTTVGVNEDTGTYIAYCFAEKQGFSKFGKYTGNGNADGTFVYTGFRPAFVLFKGLTSNREWILADNKRDPINEVDAVLYGNTNDAEGDSDMVDFLSNGFKFRTSAGPGTINTSGESYIYASFAEAPFVNSNGVPCNAR